MKKRALLLTALSLLTITTLATAGNRPGAVTFTLGEGAYRFSPKRHLDSAGVPNVALAYDFDARWAAEANVGVINTDQQRYNKHGVHGFLYTLDGLYRFAPHGRFEPYVSAGVGLLSIAPSGVDSPDQTNINAGIGTQWFADKSIALRGELRDLYTLSGGKNDLMLNLGVSFLFWGN